MQKIIAFVMVSANVLLHAQNEQKQTMINYPKQSESDPTSIAVFIGGVYQQPTTNYTVSGTTISFTSAPPAPGINPNRITIIHNLNSTNAS